MDDGTAVRLAYGTEVGRIGELLRGGQSVLVTCDRAVATHLWAAMVRTAGRSGIVADRIGRLPAALDEAADADVVVLPYLDLMADRTGLSAPGTAAELIAVLHEHSEPILLGLADPGLPIPQVVADRFSMKVNLHGVPRHVVDPATGDPRWFTEVLLTPDEAARFPGLDPARLHRMVAGLNAVQLRRAIRYAVAHSGDDQELYEAIRAFKVSNSRGAVVPTARFDDIGGYNEVKSELAKMVGFLTRERQTVPGLEWLHREFTPHAILLHGPPGTGKTTFAHAVAHNLDAVAIATSGPQLLDEFVGGTERRIAELFAEARRFAPAVVVIDELDSIAPDRFRGESPDPERPTAAGALAVELDRTPLDAPVLVVGITNRLDLIDADLLRPTRFRAVAVPLPTAASRREMAALFARRLNLWLPDELLDLVAITTESASGSEIRDLFVEAALVAAERGEMLDKGLLTEQLDGWRDRRRSTGPAG